MDCKERVEEYLKEHDVPYESASHSEAYTAQEVAAAQHVSGHEMAKVVMMWADDQMAMLVVPASGRVDFRQAAEVIGASKVWLATEKEFAQRFPDCLVGAMPPFGNLYDLPVYVDPTLLEQKEMTFRVGTYTETMQIKTADFERLVQPHEGRLTYEA